VRSGHGTFFALRSSYTGIAMPTTFSFHFFYEKW
jgi:hypothetical protein